MKVKSKTANCIKDYINLMELNTASRVKILPTDNGGEFINKGLENFFSSRRIRHETSRFQWTIEEGDADDQGRSNNHATRSQHSRIPVGFVCVVYLLNMFE